MKIGIYSNPHKDKSGRHAKELCDLLDKYQAEYFLCVSEKFSLDCAGFVPDAVIAFGGDGTMLRAVSECAEKDIPILGVNLGKVGFLTEIGCENMREAAEKLLEEPDPVSAFHQLQKLHQEFREIGPVAKDLRESVWERFKSASTQINKHHQEYYEKIKA